MLLSNQKRFDAKKYSQGGATVNEAVLDWYEIPDIAYAQILEVHETQIRREDNLLLNFELLTEKEE